MNDKCNNNLTEKIVTTINCLIVTLDPYSGFLLMRCFNKISNSNQCILSLLLIESFTNIIKRMNEA